MGATEQRDEELFAARLRAGLRELDGVERAPDVSSLLARRLAESTARASHPHRASRWALAAALLGIGVVGALLARPYFERSGDPAAVEAQDPRGAWRLVYELPIDELQRAQRGASEEGEEQNKGLEQSLVECVESVRARLGSLGEVKRASASTLVVDLLDASRASVAAVRARIETKGLLEMRMLADGDYEADSVRFDMDEERQLLRKWLDGGGRERVLRDPAAIRSYRASSEHLRWFVGRVMPSARRPGRWGPRYTGLRLGVVALYEDKDWNGGEIPAHVQAQSAAERVLFELFPVNMHERHFDHADLDPAQTKIHQDTASFGVAFRVRPEFVKSYARWSVKHHRKTCACIWDGEVLRAPQFVSRVEGRGILAFLGQARAEAMAAALASPLAALPRLVKSEAR